MGSLGVRLALVLLGLDIQTISSYTNPAGNWFNPPPCDCPNQVYVVGETIELHWATPYPNYSIALWQNFPPGAATQGPIIYQTNQPTDGFFNWSVSPLGLNLSSKNVFFFWLFPLTTHQGSQDPAYPSLISHFFNITEPKEAVTTGSSSSASSTASSSTYVSTSVPSQPSTATPPAKKQSGRLSSRASAGIGVGITIAVICFIAGALWWYRRQRRKRSLGSTSQPQTINHFELPASLDQKPVDSMQQNGQADADGRMTPVELESHGHAAADGRMSPVELESRGN